MAARRIGQVLVDLGYIDEEQLELLLEEQAQRPNEKLGQIAIGLNMLNEDQLTQALAEQFSLPVVNISDLTIPPEVLAHLTEPMAQLYRAIPISFRNDVLTVAMCEPQNLSVRDELRNFLGYEVRVVVSTPREIDAALDRYYASDKGDSVESIVQELASDKTFWPRRWPRRGGSSTWPAPRRWPKARRCASC